ncbi:RidA family protein [Dongia sp.]|uniref:RidA family protein n=1 Tax=Dongia sp. TaxID=1977262 RepID=UPI0037529BD4
MTARAGFHEKDLTSIAILAEMDVKIERIGKTERLSRVVVHEKVAYFSGLTADDRKQDVVGQTRQILEKADTFLESIGSNRAAVLSATIWLRDIADFDRMNTAWIEWIDRNEPPARATVQAVLGLPDIQVEIQFTAAVPS